MKKKVGVLRADLRKARAAAEKQWRVWERAFDQVVMAKLALEVAGATVKDTDWLGGGGLGGGRS